MTEPNETVVDTTKDLNKEDIIDLLKDTSEEEEVVEEKKEKEEEDEEKLEIKEDEEDKEEIDEELDLIAPVKRKEILGKYPQLFKDFPYLERAYYKEQQYTDLLPTIDDAKEAVQKSQMLDRFENDLAQGNTKVILEAIKKTDPESFNRVVDNYLITLEDVDKDAYVHVLGNIMKNTIVSMVQEAKVSANEKLMETANILHQFIFGTSEFKPATKLASDKSPDSAEERLKKDREAFTKERFDTARGDLDTRVKNTIKSTISENIDPKGDMTDYVKKNAIREALEELEGSIESDDRFTQILNGLWKKAFETNFSKPSLDKIRSAYLSKAKMLLPSTIKKVRNEALRGTGHKVKKEDDKGHLPVSRNVGSRKTSEPKEMSKKMSTLDYLMQDD